MNWLSYAIGGAFLSSLWSLSVKEGITSVFSTDFASWYSVVACVLLTIFNLVRSGPTSFSVSPWGLSAGVFQAIAGLALTKSFKNAPNPGLTMSVFRTQAILTAILAYFLFGSNLSPSKLAAMAVVSGGVYLVSKTKHESFVGTETLPETKHNQVSSTPAGSRSWLLLAIIGGVAMSCKDVTTKWAILHPKSKLTNILWNSLLIQCVIILIYDKYTTGNPAIHDHTGDGVIDGKDKLLIVWTGIIFLVYVASVIVATKLAPNVGYAKAVDTLGVLLTTVAAYYLWKAPITRDAILGIFLIIGGIMYVSIT